MLKISYAGCLVLSPAISSQFTVECALQPEIAKKIYQNPLLGGLRSFKIIDVDKSE